MKIQRRVVLLLVLYAAGITAAGLAGRGSGSEATTPAGGPDSRTQPVADGCVRGDRLGIVSHKVPNWVYVGGGLVQNQVLAGLVDSKYNREKAAEPTGTDDPRTHTSYDFTFNVKPDPGYENLLGTGNFEGRGQETERLHVEREGLTFPAWAWPDRGDRVFMVGSWVWDCDHTTASGEHTEIHPFRLLWVERNPGGTSRRSPAGDREADLFSTSAGTPADTQAVCANKTKGDRVAFQDCVATPVDRVHGQGTYTLVLRAAKRPSRKARLVYRVVEVAPSAETPVTRLANGISVEVDAAHEVAKQFFVGWRPVKKAARPVHLRVRLRALLVRRAMDPSCPKYDRNCAARDESTLVDQNTKPPGEWNVYVDAGGVWTPWKPLLIHPTDGETFRSAQTIDLYVAKGKPWRLFVQARECDFGSLGSAYSVTADVAPCPHNLELGNGVSDDQPGIVAVHFRSPAASLGMHRANSELDPSSCPRSNVKGCYRLTFTISRIRP